MAKPYSMAFRRKMVARLVGKDSASANELARQSGVSQAALSAWLREARNVPDVSSKKPVARDWSVEEKVRVLGEASKLQGEQLTAYLQKENLQLWELERWRTALQEGGETAAGTSKRVRKLERELVRKDKALAEAAALLLLKKKVEDHFGADEDDDTDEKNEK